LTTLIDVAIAGNYGQRLIDQLVEFGREQLDKNRFEIRLKIRSRSPWWLPRVVDEQIYDQLVAEFERILDEVGGNPAHPARQQFNDKLRSMKQSLEADDEVIRRGRELWDELLDHPDVRGYVSGLAARIREHLQEALATPDSALRIGIERELRGIGATLASDEAVAAALNRRLEELLIHLIESYRDSLSRIVSDTIEQWDPVATSRRIELYIGRDLQFIRVNGTLVGGLVGVLIYVVWSAFV